MSHPVLNQLLNDNARFALSHRGTVNHLPMALIALSHMGADEARLKAYFDWWETNVALPREGAEAPIRHQDWREALGRPALFWPLADSFQAWIEAVGPDVVVAEVAPGLSDAPASFAFHAVIRLAYGLEAEHAGEIAAGLASWVATYNDLGLGTRARPAATTVKAGLDRIAEAVGGRAPMPGSITGALRTVAGDPAFTGSLSAAPAHGGDLLSLLARAAVRLYGQLPNFTVLHMITGVHAARVLFERFPSLATNAASEALWGDWCAAYATVGAPAFRDEAPLGPAADWPAIFVAARASDDDHVIKLAYSCAREQTRYGGEAHQVVATRLVGLG